MKVLLDTCTFLWILSDPSRLSSDALELFAAPEQDAFLSSVSTWEVSVKNALGRLPLPEPLTEFVPKMRRAHGVKSLNLDEESTLYLPLLPLHHKDPFDRMLICQAIVHDLTILTPDPLIRQYAVKTKW